jgi:hypothetical protein
MPSAREVALKLIEEIVGLNLPNHEENRQRDDVVTIEYIKSVVHSDLEVAEIEIGGPATVMEILSAKADGM